MQRGMLMLLIGGTFSLLGLITMPMKRTNPRQNLIDNPFGWGLFGFGLSSLLIGISAMSKEKRTERKATMVSIEYPINRKEINQDIAAPEVH